MPNSIKHSTSAQTDALGVGDMHIGLDGKGPTSSTGFYTGINPPSGGYTVYYNKASGGPSITTKANDAALIAEANGVTGESMSTITEVLTYYAGQSDKMVMHNPIAKMHAADLSAYYTAGSILSYPRSGTSWIDISGEAKNGTLTNGPTFSSNGYFDFDGTDDFVSTEIALSQTTYTKIAWFNPDGATANIISGGSDGQHAFWMQSTSTHLRAGHNGTWNRVSYSPGTMTGKWWCGAVTFSTTTGWKLYLNGELVDTSDNTSTFSGGTAVRIAAYNNAANLFNGKIATAQIYNKILTAAEISTNYYQGSIVTAGLVGAFDASNLVSYENESTTAYSLKDVSETGDLDNGVAFSSENGGTWVFDGVDDQIDFGNPSSLSNAQVTVTFWYNPTTLMNNTHGGIINGRTPGGRFCLFWINGTTLSTQYRDDSGLSRAAGGTWTRSQTATGAVSSTNQWYFIQITGNESTDEWRVGVDLNVSTTDFGSQYVDPDSNQWLLGRRASAAYDHSKIANLQIYDRVLSQSEIAQNYNANVNKFN